MNEKSERISKTVAASLTIILIIIVSASLFLKEVALALAGSIVFILLCTLVYGVYKIIESFVDGPIYNYIARKQFAKDQVERLKKIREWEEAHPDNFYNEHPKK